MKLQNTFTKKLSVKSMIILTLAVSGALVLSPWATASSSAATNYAGLCGTGYVHKKSFTIPGGVIKAYVKGSGSNSLWCAFTVKTTNVGRATYVSTGVDEILGWYHNRNTYVDSGSYKYYAGPAKKPQRMQSVVVRGVVGSAINGGYEFRVSN